MPISAVGGSSYPQLTLPTAATKPADTDAPAPAATQSASSQSKPDADAATTSAAGSPSSSSSVNFTKINPDGTVGPLHHHRHANSPGVVHA